jgi:haloalkane dehalogenase
VPSHCILFAVEGERQQTACRTLDLSRFAELSGLLDMTHLAVTARVPALNPERSLDLLVRTVVTPSGNISYIDEGEGPPVLLLHGAPVTSVGFVRVIRGLRPHHRVIAPDLPGFGRSSVAASFRGSLSDYARSIEEFCLALKLDRFVLFGFDSSGAPGIAAATKMASRIAGLVIADTVPIPLVGRAWFVKMVLRHIVTSRLVRFLNRRFNLLPWVVATVDPHRHPFTAAERAILTGQYDSAVKRDRVLDMFSAMWRDDAFMRRTAAEATSALGDTPVLLLFGRLDPMRFAGGVSRCRKMFPRSSVCVIPRERHFPILASGGEVAFAIATWIRERVTMETGE